MPADHLSATFAALADPTRRAILARLVSGQASVTELAAPFEMSMPAISKHLKVLEHAGLIARGRDAQWRPCRLEAAPLKDVADWVAHYKRFWEQSFDRLDDYLRELKKRRRRMAASKERNSAAANAPQRELVLTRVFDAPREVVFRAWTDPERLAQWWGPRGFTNPRCEWDARPGGAIRVDMKGPDGTVYPMGR